MLEPSPRKPFQIHLSTAIVLMFVAGGLIWANMRERVDDGELETPYDYSCYGWPFTVASRINNIIIAVGKRRWEFKYGNTAINIAVSLVILFAVWFVCEWLIRRGAVRKGA